MLFFQIAFAARSTIRTGAPSPHEHVVRGADAGRFARTGHVRVFDCSAVNPDFTFTMDITSWQEIQKNEAVRKRLAKRIVRDCFRDGELLWNLSTAKLKRRQSSGKTGPRWPPTVKLFECSGFGFREEHS